MDIHRLSIISDIYVQNAITWYSWHSLPMVTNYNWHKLGIGANSGPAVLADSLFMGMVVFARFFFFILHVELCMRQVVPFSPGQNGHWILFLLRKTCTESLRPTRSFLRFFFFPLKSLVKRFCSFFLPALPAFLSFESYYYTSKRNSTRKFPIVLRCVPAAEKPKKKQHQPKNHIDGSV